MDHQEPHGKVTPFLLLAVLGIVYGDIGTSPLYALKETLHSLSGGATPQDVLGVLSLIFWAISLVVSVKYILLIMQADNHGEGGILALLTLAVGKMGRNPNKNFVMLGLIGAALFFGDGIITPAISVLSALEGLTVISPHLDMFVIPLSLIIVALLFLSQSKGTAAIGSLFGPIMLGWFLTLGVLGIVAIQKFPDVLMALNPFFAFMFMVNHGWATLITLGSVVLAITGAEALYADMGHFGRSPIRISWFWCVYPCLVLNYFGQGAQVLHHPEAIHNPFYSLVPLDGVIPMVILSTIATIIASQALISGVFSVAGQAIQLNFFPRMWIRHTSSEHRGQIYVSAMNWMLFILVGIVIMTFKTSSALAGAYGFAVTGLMVITSILTLLVAKEAWGWSRLRCALVFCPILLLDGLFFLSTSLKIMEGAWLPILLASFVFLIMSTWYKGRDAIKHHTRETNARLENLKKTIQSLKPKKVSGTAVYLATSADRVPSSFMMNIEHNKVVHSHLVFLTIHVEDVPKISSRDRVSIEMIEENIYRVQAFYGFMEQPSIPAILEKCKKEELLHSFDEVTIFLTRGVPFSRVPHSLFKWQAKLYIFLAKNALNGTEFFRIPYDRAIELGARWRL